MTFYGLHLADWTVLVLYAVLLFWIGRRTGKSVHDERDFFLAGRKLGGWLQFFLNFGQMTESSGAARTSSVVYNSGVGGVWLSLQTLFMTPYYWFMNAWFRRVRLTTVADLFSDRFGTRRLAVIYAITTVFFNIIGIGSSYLIAYKMVEIIVVKPVAAYSASEKAMVSEYYEFVKDDTAYRKGQLDPGVAARYADLKSLSDAGAIKSYISYVRPVPFYLVFALVVGAYIILGGMNAAAITDAMQGVLIVIFSVILIPFGLMRLGGLHAYQDRLPDRMLELFGSGAGSEFAWYSILAILLISLIQGHAVAGNMGIAGSARTEEAAAIGAIGGGFMKRWMIIAWCICGLIAYALFGQSNQLNDPDAVWGALSCTLLGPGFLGLMLVGLLAGDMSSMSAHSLTLSALFVKNVFQVIFPRTTDKQGLFAGRLFIVITLLLGIGIALLVNNIVTFMKLALTLNVAFGAAVFLVFKWRRITEQATIISVLISLIVIVVVPLLVPAIPALSQMPALHVLTREQREVVQSTKKITVIPPAPLYFDRVVKVRPDDPHSPKQGEGRFQFEVYLASRLGFDFRNFEPAQLLAYQYLFDSLLPFILLFPLSLLTREHDPGRAERFYIKMRTRADADAEKDAANLAYAYAHPLETEKRKLFHNSHWEFQRWRRADYIAFPLSCLIALAILGIFSFVLTIGRK